MEAWLNKLEEACKLLFLEPVEVGEGEEKVVYIVGSKIPDSTVRDNLSKLIPINQKYEFVRAMKKSTKEKVDSLLQYLAPRMGFDPNYCRVSPNNDGVLFVMIPAEPSPVFNLIAKGIEAEVFKIVKQMKDDFIVEVRVQPLPPLVIIGIGFAPPGTASSPLSKDHPVEKQDDKGIITKDDICDLKIALGKSNSVDDFLKSIGVEDKKE